MPLEVIYVVRHGFRSAWSVDPVSGVYTASVRSPTGIAADPPLTSHGARQAEELGHLLMTLDPPIDAVYSSPYYRCLQTINPFVKLKRRQLDPNLPDASGSTDALYGTAATMIRPEHGIAEWFGSAPFDHPQPASAEMLKSMFPAYSLDYVSTQTPSKKGETMTQLYERLSTTARTIIDRCDAEGNRAIVLCTHAAAVIGLGRVLTGNVPPSPEVDDFQAFTCGLSVYRRKGGNCEMGKGKCEGLSSTAAASLGGWACELNSDCSFLSGGAERGWRFSGDESFPGTGSMSQATEPKL